MTKYRKLLETVIKTSKSVSELEENFKKLRSLGVCYNEKGTCEVDNCKCKKA